MIVQIVAAGGTMVIGVLLFLSFFMFLDPDHGLFFGKRDIFMICLGSVVAAAVWAWTTAEMEPMMRVVWLLIHILFLSCSMTDHQTYQVYDISQYVGVCLTGYLVFQSAVFIWHGVSVLLFVLLQYFIFMRLYGKADGMIFLTAALAETSLGGDICTYLFHMILSYLLLSVVQGVRGNIRRKGKLARPVAFLPYITVSFWVVLLMKDLM